jgi:TRAP-type C4-dicarboxylate transport system permease small subunit
VIWVMSVTVKFMIAVTAVGMSVGVHIAGHVTLVRTV